MKKVGKFLFVFSALIISIFIISSVYAFSLANLFKITGQAIYNDKYRTTCADSDGGLNYYAKGIVSYEYRTYTKDYPDSCSTTYSNVLMERYCSRGYKATKPFTCPDKCVDGACVNETVPAPQTPPCTDSDGGLNYYVKGTTEESDGAGNGVSVIDYCYTSDILTEGFCSGNNKNQTDYTCSNGCQDGVCVNQSETETNRCDVSENNIYDFNDDLILNNSDINFIYSIYLGTNTIECPSGKTCDLNNDGEVSMADVLLLTKYTTNSCNPICSSNADCGTDAIINKSCSADSKSVCTSSTTYTCNNPGTEISSCSTSVSAGCNACSDRDICSNGECISAGYLCNTRAVYVPTDTKCKNAWPTTEGSTVGFNSNTSSCNLYEVCNAEMDAPIAEAISCCEGSYKLMESGTNSKGKTLTSFKWSWRNKNSDSVCAFSRKNSQDDTQAVKLNTVSLSDFIGKSLNSKYKSRAILLLNYTTLNVEKRCQGLYLIKGLGTGKKWMTGYFSAEACCAGSIFCSNKFSYGTCQPIAGFNNYAKQLPCTKSIPPSIWASDTDMGKNTCKFADLPAHASLNILKTGTCADYSTVLTTLLRKAGYSSNETMSVLGTGHVYNLVKLPFDDKYHFVDTTENDYDISLYSLPSVNRSNCLGEPIQNSVIIPKQTEYQQDGGMSVNLSISGKIVYDYCAFLKSDCENDLGNVNCPSQKNIYGCGKNILGFSSCMLGGIGGIIAGGSDYKHSLDCSIISLNVGQSYSDASCSAYYSFSTPETGKICVNVQVCKEFVITRCEDRTVCGDCRINDDKVCCKFGDKEKCYSGLFRA